MYAAAATLIAQIEAPPPPPEIHHEPSSFGIGPFGLIALAAIGYIVYRGVQARRDGEDVGKAVGRAALEAAPPAIAASIGFAFVMMAMMLVMMLMIPFVFFLIIASFFTAFGAEPPGFGPFAELAGPAIVMLTIGMLFVFAALAWLLVAVWRRTRRPRPVHGTAPATAHATATPATATVSSPPASETTSASPARRGRRPLEARRSPATAPTRPRASAGDPRRTG